MTSVYGGWVAESESYQVEKLSSETTDRWEWGARPVDFQIWTRSHLLLSGGFEVVVGWPAGDVRLLQATEVCWGWVKENGVLEFSNEEKVMLFLDKIFNWNILIQDSCDGLVFVVAVAMAVVVAMRWMGVVGWGGDDHRQFY
ncbi:hypothetical protein L1987_02384 [Smallanthus sonchifolius]|uniref:Uncharacterized protein n=1 Tax=Smallanthus sonchifolius TaxID=185202 RepID=A0ACB9K7L5_9ASTR|nr:hypothetical protein L1987_02384 [Smallanthus sonchifolius]